MAQLTNCVSYLLTTCMYMRLQEFLTHNALYWEADSEGEGDDSFNATMMWPKLTWVDMSENDILELPASMVCVGKCVH